MPALSEATRLLRPGGALVAVEPGSWHPVGAALGLANRAGLGTKVHGTPDDIPLSPRRLEADARAAGLEPELHAVTYSWRRLPPAAQRALHRLDGPLGSRPRAAPFGHTLLLLARPSAGRARGSSGSTAVTSGRARGVGAQCGRAAKQAVAKHRPARRRAPGGPVGQHVVGLAADRQLGVDRAPAGRRRTAAARGACSRPQLGAAGRDVDPDAVARRQPARPSRAADQLGRGLDGDVRQPPSRSPPAEPPAPSASQGHRPPRGGPAGHAQRPTTASISDDRAPRNAKA